MDYLKNQRKIRNQRLKEYQITIAEGLSRIYSSEQQVQTEWSAMLYEEVNQNSTRYPHKHMYQPKLDIAVGPFATERQFINEYDDLMISSRQFIDAMIESHRQNVVAFGSRFGYVSFDLLNSKNRNARCFLVVEIERGNISLKYLMGSAVNAAALGRIGIVVAWDDIRLKSLMRVREYLLYLGEMSKNTFDTTNLLILTKEQFQQCVENLIVTRTNRGETI